MKQIFKLDPEIRKKRLIRSAIIFPISIVVILFANYQNITFSIELLTSLLILATMFSGFPYGWNIARNIILSSYRYNDITGEYYHDNSLMTTIFLYPVALTVGLVVGGILLVIDLLLFLIPNAYKKVSNK